MWISCWRRYAATSAVVSSAHRAVAPSSSGDLESPLSPARASSAVDGSSVNYFSGSCSSENPSEANSTSSVGCSLLGYPIRRAAAHELLYGGVRIQHLVQPVFPLQRIRSENLPSPSLQAEREDLGLEMQLPSHKDPTQLPSYRIQNQVSSHDQVNYDDGYQDSRHDGFDMSQFFNDLHHPELHHNSSPPYNPATNTNNVLALRLFPVNIGIRDRTEAIRLRTMDCLERVQQWKLTARLGLPVRYPIPMSLQKALRHEATRIDSVGKPRSLFSGAIDPSKRHTPSTLPSHSTTNGVATPFIHLPSPDTFRRVRENSQVGKNRSISASFLPHMKGKLHFHPPPSSLSIFTHSPEASYSTSFSRNSDGALSQAPDTLHSLFGRTSHPRRSSWMPFQMLKPMGYNWSPTRRSSGVRGPSAQLVQERLDQKGFGWKRKSRYLWQQDIDTAGFRPHRFF